MPRDIKKLAYTLREYIRELDHEAFERVRNGAWLVASLGTEDFLEKPDEEIAKELQERLPEEIITCDPWLVSFLRIAREWARINFYANESWPDGLVTLYEKHGVKE